MKKVSNPNPAHEKYQYKPYLGSSHTWAMAQLDHLAPEASVLDIGSGRGAIGTALRERGFSDVVAVEVDQASRDFVKDIYSEIYADLTEIGERLFDTILLLDVLEHLNEPELFLHSAVSHLSPGGKILISVPNIAHWSTRFGLLFGQFNYTERGILDRTHYQFFTRKRFTALIEQTANLKLRSIGSTIEPAEFVLPRWVWNNAAFRYCSRLRLGAAQILPGLLAYQHVAVAEKTP